MSGFSAGWLALREKADLAARAPNVLAACAAYFTGRNGITVCDLGAGTGAAVDAFSSLLPTPQKWILADDDGQNLQQAASQRTKSGVVITPQRCNLAEQLRAWPDGTDLVTATALFDLAGPGWIEALCGLLAAEKLPLLATITYSGEQAFEPPLPDDAQMLAAFNKHQRLDKGLGGPAAGPAAASHLVGALTHAGYSIVQGESPWLLTADQNKEMIAAIVTGWSEAVGEAGLVELPLAQQWKQARLAKTDGLTVSHTDLFATPPK